MAALVDSQQQELDVEEILDIANENSREPTEISRYVAALNDELQTPNTLFIRQGNTLFVVNKTAPGQAKFRPVNADTIRNFLENIMEFIKASQKMGFDTLSSEFSDPSLLSVFRYVSQNPPIEDMGYEEKSNKENGFNVTIKTNA